MTFYLKYRPQKIEELDLESVRQQLSTVIKSKKIPHAFLFTGPRGLGKTSAARILAKAINCETKKKAAFEPCNHCSACISITRGSALDVMEIDGASNRGIDDVRQLREQIKLSPVQLPKKIYVIDEVHMLTPEAFNALLKTLEEPPEHVFFILATTEPEKLPATIVSRCFIIPFVKPSEGEIKRALQRVIRGEKLKIDEPVLSLIASQADGSFRDAVKILEQLALAGKKIDEKLYHSIFNQIQNQDFLHDLEEKNTRKALTWIKKANESGIDWKSFLQATLFCLRDNLLAIYGVGEGEKYQFNEAELKLLIKLFSQAAQALRGTPILHLPIELAVIEYCSHKKNEEMASKKAEDEGEETLENETGGDKESLQMQKKDAPLIKFSELENKWEEVLRLVKPQNHSVEALLRASRPKAIDGKKVLIEVFYEFHKGRLETEKCRRVVDDSIRRVFNKELWADYVLGDKNSKHKLIGEPLGENEAEEDSNELVKTAKEVFGS